MSETILRAFLIRRSILIGQGLGVKVVGPPLAPATREIVDFLARSRIPHALVELDSTAEVRDFAVGADDLPLVVLGGRILRNPRTTWVARALGLTTERRTPNHFASCARTSAPCAACSKRWV